MARRKITRKPIPRPDAPKPEGWEKIKPKVLGIGITLIIVIGIIVGVSFIFHSSYRGADVYIEREPDLSSLETNKKGKTPPAKKTSERVTNPVTPATNENAGDTFYAQKNTTAVAAGTLSADTTTTAAVIDSEALRKEIEKRVQAEIKKQAEFYHNKRQSLRDEAVAFLRAKHSQRGVKMKAANYRKLAQKLLEDIKKFGEPSSEAEGKIWEAQKDELRKSADYCNDLANRIEMTGGIERKMRITASQLETEEAP